MRTSHSRTISSLSLDETSGFVSSSCSSGSSGVSSKKPTRARSFNCSTSSTPTRALTPGALTPGETHDREPHASVRAFIPRRSKTTALDFHDTSTMEREVPRRFSEATSGKSTHGENSEATHTLRSSQCFPECPLSLDSMHTSQIERYLPIPLAQV